jgi:hypothetical protein
MRSTWDVRFIPSVLIARYVETDISSLPFSSTAFRVGLLILCRTDEKNMNDFSQGMMSRRTLLLGAAMSSAWQAFAKETPENAVATETASGDPGKLKICIFSKHLQWASISDAASIARDVGFDGVDITVRAEGHVLPERVETDLPAAVEAVRRPASSDDYE